MEEEQWVEALRWFFRLPFCNETVDLLICHPKVPFPVSHVSSSLIVGASVSKYNSLQVLWTQGKGWERSAGTYALISLARLFPNIQDSLIFMKIFKPIIRICLDKHVENSIHSWLSQDRLFPEQDISKGQDLVLPCFDWKKNRNKYHW